VGSYLRSSMRAVDEQVVMYQKRGVGATTNLTLGAVFNQSAFLQQLVTVQVGAASSTIGAESSHLQHLQSYRCCIVDEHAATCYKSLGL